MKASTLPDNMEKATICEGIYEVSNTAHSRSRSNGGYAALTLNNDLDIPAYNSKTGNDYANLVHFHMAGPFDPGSTYSLGCITMPMNSYREFGVHVGFIKDLPSNKTAASDTYGEWANTLVFKGNTKDFHGNMVIDRQYYDDTKGYLKFNGLKGQE